MSNNHIEIESLEGLTNKPFIIKMLHNDFRWWHSGVEMFQLSRLADGITTALVSHGDLENGITYIQGLAKIDRIVDSLTIDEQLTVRGISGHHLNHFVLDLKTNELKIKMNDGVEAIQFAKLSQPKTVSIVSHGDPSGGILKLNGIVEIDGELRANGESISKSFSTTALSTTAATQSIDCGIVNSELDIRTKLYISSASHRELITVDTSYDGSSYSSAMSYRDLHRFSGLSVAYNLSLSLSTGRHHFDLIGTGNGTSITIKAVTDIN